MSKSEIDYHKLILAGIAESSGQESDAQFVDPNWVKSLGIRAANVGAMLRKEFPRWVVEPICDMELAAAKTDHSKYTLDGVKLPSVNGAKRVHVVAFDYDLAPLEYLEKLTQHGLRPCSEGPSYLAGLMARVPREEMPVELQRKWIVAAGPGNIIRLNFLGKPPSGYLYAAIAPNDHCSFDIIEVPPVLYFPTHWDTRWAFLAEDLS